METAGEGPLKKPGRFRRGVDVVLDFIAGCVSPVIPVLLASGLIAAVLSICVNFFGMDVGSGTAVVLSAVKDFPQEKSWASTGIWGPCWAVCWCTAPSTEHRA